MLSDLATQVLTEAGCSGEAIRATAARIETAVAELCARDRQLGVEFRARDGEMAIVISSGAGPVWHTSCPMS
jgi:hypothetical protein